MLERWNVTSGLLKKLRPCSFPFNLHIKIPFLIKICSKFPFHFFRNEILQTLKLYTLWTNFQYIESYPSLHFSRVLDTRKMILSQLSHVQLVTFLFHKVKLCLFWHKSCDIHMTWKLKEAVCDLRVHCADSSQREFAEDKRMWSFC